MKLITREVDEGRRNAEGVSISRWLDQRVQQPQVVLKGQHVAAEGRYPRCSDPWRKSACAIHIAAKFKLYTTGKVLCVAKEVPRRVHVPLRTFLFFAVFFDEVGESVKASGVMEKSR